MNTLAVIILVYTVLAVLAGMRRGLFKTVFYLLAMVAAMAAAYFLGPQLSGYVTDNTDITEQISGSVTSAITGHGDHKEPETRKERARAVNSSGYSDMLSDALLANDNQEFFDALGVDTFFDYIGAYVARIMVNFGSCVLVFILSWFVFRIIAGALSRVAALPVLRSIDRLGGAVLGLAKAAIFITLFFLVVTAMSESEAGRWCISMIDSSPALSYIYDNNPLILKLSDITSQIFS